MDARDRPPPDDTFSGWPEPLGVRVRDIGEIAVGLPHLFGFHPRESVVLIGLGGESGRRVGLTVRADIPAPEHGRDLARVLAGSLCRDRPDGALVLVVSEAPDEEFAGEPDIPHRGLVWEMVKALAEYAVPVGDAVLVRDGRWWSYDCPDHCCAPGRGRPLPTGVTELEVASIATGTVVAGSREDLVARIAPQSADPGPMADTCARVAVECTAAILDVGREAVAAESWAAVTAAVACRRPGGPGDGLTDAEVARIVCGLRDGEVRDRAFGLALGEEPATAEALWAECTRRAPAPLDAVPATLLAVCAWLRGDGAMANIALARAVDSDPGYAFARLLSDALAACLTPSDLRALLVEAGPPPPAG